MLYFFVCDSFPKPIPQDPSSLVTWQRQLSSLAERAMNALTEEIPTTSSKRITSAYLLKAEIVKDWDNPNSPISKRPPKDKPNAVLAHFGFNSK